MSSHEYLPPEKKAMEVGDEVFYEPPYRANEHLIGNYWIQEILTDSECITHMDDPVLIREADGTEVHQVQVRHLSPA